MRYKLARGVRDAALTILQMRPKKRRKNSLVFTDKELLQILELYDEHKPKGLQETFFRLISYELAFRGGETANCVTNFFQEV